MEVEVETLQEIQESQARYAESHARYEKEKKKCREAKAATFEAALGLRGFFRLIIELMWKLGFFKGRTGVANPIKVGDGPAKPYTQKAFYTSVVLRGLFGDAAPPPYMSYRTLERREALWRWLHANPSRYEDAKALGLNKALRLIPKQVRARADHVGLRVSLFKCAECLCRRQQTVDMSQDDEEEEEGDVKEEGRGGQGVRKGVLLFRYPLGEGESDRLPLTDLDEATLGPGQWLNDEVINLCFK
jgi:hypothetical protein